MCMKKIIIVLLFMITIIGALSLRTSTAFASDIGIGAASYLIVDQNGNVLLSKNENEKREVASICKLMTSLIVLEKLDAGEISINDLVTISAKAGSVEGSSAFLDAGSRYTVGDLLKSVIVASANDSAVALAEYVAGSEYRFTDMMNLKAKDIGMNDTLYVNSTGLSGNNQYSTAHDTSIVLDKVSRFDLYREYSQIWMDELIHPSGRKTELVNTNRLIKYVDYCKCGKTGFTDDAGYCLATMGNINGMNLTCVVLGCKNSAGRFTDSINLYSYARDNYTSAKIVDSTIDIDNSIFIEHGRCNTIKLRADRDYYATIRTGEDNLYSFRYELPVSIKAPIYEGDIVGCVYVLNSDDIVAKIDIVSSVTIDRQNYGEIVKNLMAEFNKI